MSDFGFEAGRSATLPGLNAKLSEVGALLALTKLEALDAIVDHRALLAETYRTQLPELHYQQLRGRRVAHQFMPALLPAGWAERRAELVAGLDAQGIGCRTYFSPHLREQAWFEANSVAGDLRVTDDVAARVLSLPMADDMTSGEVTEVAGAVRAVMGSLA
jgi:dTDP-4-amino-4,6-dideoxygalactose transaminase